MKEILQLVAGEWSRNIRSFAFLCIVRTGGFGRNCSSRGLTQGLESQTLHVQYAIYAAQLTPLAPPLAVSRQSLAVPNTLDPSMGLPGRTADQARGGARAARGTREQT